MNSTDQLLELAIEAALIAGRRTLKFYNSELDVVVKEDNSPLTLADLEANQVINEKLQGTGIPVLSEENRIISYEERKSWNTLWLVDPLDGTKEFINKRSEYTINIALIRKGTPVLGVVYAPVLNKLYYGNSERGSYSVVTEENDHAADVKQKSKKMVVGRISEKISVVGSRSHLSDETKAFVKKLGKYIPVKGLKSMGSSLKLCMVADGKADIYPRLGPTMEWDTAASHAVVIHAGCEVIEAEKAGPLIYNKENLLNPYFIVFNPGLKNIVLRILTED
jgi:3'(2'), 5'-bisphosphate nucleotidase